MPENEPPEEPFDPRKVTLADIKGLTEAKEIVFDSLINPILHPDVYRKLGVVPVKGMLLYGPPGTGKTMFGRAVANELQTEFISVSMADIRGKTSLQTVELISSLFVRAGNCENGCVLFLDDCEELLSRQGSAKAYGVSQFLNELDGIKKSGDRRNVFVLIATNRPWMIASALLRSGRISASVHITLPDKEARQQIITAALKDVPLAEDVNIDELVELTEGFSGAEIFHKENGGGICNEARKFAARRWIRRRSTEIYGTEEYNRVELVSREDFEQALQTVVPTSVRNAELIDMNRKFSEKLKSREYKINE